MRNQLNELPMDKREAMDKIGKTRVKGDALSIKCKVIGFMTGKGASMSQTYENGDSSILVMLMDVDKISEKAGVMRINPTTGLPEVNMTISVKEKKDKQNTDEVVKYIRSHYVNLVESSEKYKGTFKEMLDYWDPIKGCLAKNLWYPLMDEMGNPLVIVLNIWRGDVPADIKPGMILDVPGCSFNHYLYIPKAKGPGGNNKTDAVAQAAAIAKAEKEARVVSSPTAPNEDADAQHQHKQQPIEETVSRISPTIRISGNVDSGVFVSRDYADCSAFDSFFADVQRDRRRHQIRMPHTYNDNYCMVLSLGGYQNDRCMSFDDFEPGPSNGVLPSHSYEKSDYEKLPLGVDAKSEAREPMKTIRLNVWQYSKEKVDPDRDLHWSVEFKLYADHTLKTGITIHEKWLKFGCLPWEGVAVVTVDATGTLQNALNQPANRKTYKTNGKIECWIKDVNWGIRGTCKSQGLLLKTMKLLQRLYADIISTSTRDDGTKKVELNLGTLYNKTATSRLQSMLGNAVHPLHAEIENSEFININEWRTDAGNVVSSPDRDIYVLLYIPTPQQLTQEKIIRKKNQEIEEYNDECTKRLRDEFSHDEDLLIDILLGAKPVPPKKDHDGPRKLSDDFQLYSNEEIAALASFKDHKERAVALPGRNTPRIYNPKIVNKVPMTLGFDFQLYSIKKIAEDIPIISLPKKESKGKNKKINF
jgi:hypothetical protein